VHPIFFKVLSFYSILLQFILINISQQFDRPSQRVQLKHSNINVVNLFSFEYFGLTFLLRSRVVTLQSPSACHASSPVRHASSPTCHASSPACHASILTKGGKTQLNSENCRFFILAPLKSPANKFLCCTCCFIALKGHNRYACIGLGNVENLKKFHKTWPGTLLIRKGRKFAISLGNL